MYKKILQYAIGTPVITVLLLMFLFSGSAVAQNAAPQPIFSVSTQAVAIRIGGQTVAGTDAVGTFNVTPRFQLQTDNTLAPSNGLQQYVAGPKWYPAFLEKPFANTTLSGIAPYLHVAAGVVRNVPSTGPTLQHFSALGGGGFDWKVNGKFSLGPIVEYINAPGFGKSPHGLKVSANLTFVLGSK